ncbi:MAG: hypothetical protein WA208_01525 [Thermoanaerobaculia bacterium]
MIRTFEFEIAKADRDLVFREVARLRAEHPSECLSDDQLWSDHSEKANGISRDKLSGTLCVTIAIYGTSGEKHEYFSMREDSEALLGSAMYKIITELIAPHEQLPENSRAV